MNEQLLFYEQHEIYKTLPIEKRIEVAERFAKLTDGGTKGNIGPALKQAIDGQAIDGHMALSIEAGAAEYEEIMAAQEAMT